MNFHIKALVPVSVGSAVLEETIPSFRSRGSRGRWDAAVCGRMTGRSREGAWGSDASEELLFFTCALIDPADTDG